MNIIAIHESCHEILMDIIKILKFQEQENNKIEFVQYQLKLLYPNQNEEALDTSSGMNSVLQKDMFKLPYFQSSHSLSSLLLKPYGDLQSLSLPIARYQSYRRFTNNLMNKGLKFRKLILKNRRGHSLNTNTMSYKGHKCYGDHKLLVSQLYKFLPPPISTSATEL